MKRIASVVVVLALALTPGVFLTGMAKADDPKPCTPDECHALSRLCTWGYGAILAMRTEHHKKQIKTLADCKKLAMEPPTFIQTVFGAGLGDALATTEEREASLHADQLVCACEAAFSDAPPSVVPLMQ